jgi:DNA-binding SARP family transcriptional activator
VTGRGASAPLASLAYEAYRGGGTVTRKPIHALRRERLLSRLSEVWTRRLALVVGPPGSGKTTVLTQFAAESGCPVAWYQPTGTDSSPTVLAAHLSAALNTGTTEIRLCSSVDEVGEALELVATGPLLLVVDDLHALDGTPAERELGRLFTHGPPCLITLAASRRTPRINLSDLRLSNEIVEVGADDLRFRSWEVEDLFRNHYRESIPPEELAYLTRRTEGWAAGLQLFYLATHGKSAAQRRRLLDQLGPRMSIVSEYLTANILGDLPQDLRSFLVETSVLGRLSGSLCDEFLGRTGTVRILRELERRQVFVQTLDDGATYRYHEVLRSFVVELLAEEFGESVVRERYRAAGKLLVIRGYAGEALEAYCRAEDWQGAARILGLHGERVAGVGSSWLDELPQGLLAEDPWSLLAVARRQRAAGQWRDALRSYAEAEGRFIAGTALATCQRERRTLKAWVEPATITLPDWTGVVRQATRRGSLACRESVSDGGVHQRFALGLTALLAGDVSSARDELEPLVEDRAVSPILAAAARLASAIAGILGGEMACVAGVERSAEEAEELCVPWLARLARASLVLSDHPAGWSEAMAALAANEQAGDEWGVALVSLLSGWRAVSERPQEARVLLATARETFRALHAETLAAWSTSALALASSNAGEPMAVADLMAAESSAYETGAFGARALLLFALAESDDDDADDHRALANRIATDCGLALPKPVGRSSNLTDPRPALDIRCLGSVQLSIAGHAFDLAAIKPRCAMLLRFLCLNAGRPVHREVLTEALWPNAHPDAGVRNVQVAISTLRQAFAALHGAASGWISRDGDSYKLLLPAGSRVDLHELLDEIEQARAATIREDADVGLSAIRNALNRYDELLPEVGAADWVVHERARLRGDLSATARGIADLLMHAGRFHEAQEICRSALRIERFVDALWRTLIDAAEACGEYASACEAKVAYESLLAELGLSPTETR